MHHTLGSKGKSIIPARPGQFRMPIETPRMFAEAPTEREIFTTPWFLFLDTPTEILPNYVVGSDRRAITEIPTQRLSESEKGSQATQNADFLRACYAAFSEKTERSGPLATRELSFSLQPLLISPSPGKRYSLFFLLCVLKSRISSSFFGKM